MLLIINEYLSISNQTKLDLVMHIMLSYCFF